jgi:GNAT superfamily N-acetyltransferase
MSGDIIREATLADVPQIANVFAAGFIDDDVFGRFMHPKRREYPDDWLHYWHKDIRTHLIDPTVLAYVCTTEQGIIKACCILRPLGQGGEQRAAAASLASKAQAFAEKTWDDVAWTDKAADPKAMEAFERNWEDIKHHFTGSRAECWMIEMLCVAPDAQRGGYGRQLIQKAIELCKSENPAAPLSVIASEVGDAFYEKMGFHEVGRANVGVLSDLVGGSIKFNEQHLHQ